MLDVQYLWIWNSHIIPRYHLPARYVIHTVGPKGEKPALLESCYRRALQTALDNNCRTVAFPCISTGVYGYPNESAVRVILPIVRTMLEAHPTRLDRIVFCLFLKVDIDYYHKYLPVFFPISWGQWMSQFYFVIRYLSAISHLLSSVSVYTFFSIS